VAVVADSGIDHLGIGILAERTMHTPRIPRPRPMFALPRIY
jgi:hypothetical protein